MATPNTAPIYPLTPNVGLLNCLLSTALTNTKAYDGTDTAGTALAQCYLAGAQGSRLDSISVMLSSTNGATVSGTTAACVIRFWLNNGSANTTATNNQFIGEIAIPATAMTALATAVNTVYTLTTAIAIPANYKVYAGSTVANGATNGAFLVRCQGGDY